MSNVTAKLQVGKVYSATAVTLDEKIFFIEVLTKPQVFTLYRWFLWCYIEHLTRPEWIWVTRMLIRKESTGLIQNVLSSKKPLKEVVMNVSKIEAVNPKHSTIVNKAYKALSKYSPTSATSATV